MAALATRSADGVLGPPLVAGLAASLGVGWLALLAFGGAYERRHLRAGTEEYRRVVASGLRLAVGLAAVSFALDLALPRLFVALAAPLMGGLTLASRWLHRRLLHGRHRRGRGLTGVVAVGSERTVEGLAGHLSAYPYAGFLIVRAVPPGPSLAHRAVAAARAATAGAVVVCEDAGVDPVELRGLAAALEGTGIDLLVAPAVVNVAGPRVATRIVSELPLLWVHEPELGGPRRALKGVVDRVAASVLLVALLPALVAVGLAVRATSPGPAIFRQVRVGRGGRHFQLWKFRTMAVDAERRLDLVTELNEADGVLFKIRSDPRVTRLGRHLRRWSIDELPQLWNVVRGEMSLVGPRPPLPSEVERYCEQARRRLLVRPGLTGLWQVSGRSELSWDDAVRLDTDYVENWSLSLDAAILARTFSAVLRGRGAY